MGVRVQIKVTGLEELKQALLVKADLLKAYLDSALLQVCEDAVTYAKFNKGYKDHTSNLKNSISFAFYKEGDLVMKHEGQIPQPDASKEGQAQVRENLETYCAQAGVVHPTGYTLAIVAGMNYGKYVEHKGYAVVYMTKYFLEDELVKVLKEGLDAIAKS